MKFTVDAQLPRRLVILLRRLGYEAQHTWGLDDGNRTPDETIAQLADREKAIVVTKDLDFVNSHILKASPHLDRQHLKQSPTGCIRAPYQCCHFCS